LLTAWGSITARGLPAQAAWVAGRPL